MPSRLIILFASFNAVTGSIDVILAIESATISVWLNLSFASLNISRSFTLSLFFVTVPFVISPFFNKVSIPCVPPIIGSLGFSFLPCKSKISALVSWPMNFFNAFSASLPDNTFIWLNAASSACLT